MRNVQISSAISLNRRLAVLTSCLMFSACATTPPPTVAAAPSDPVLAFVARAQPGQVEVVSSATYGGAVSLTVDRQYNSASGNICKSFNMVRPNGVSGQQLACGDGADWSYAPPLLTKQNVAGAQ